jgi:hypothetical protein
MFARVTTNTLKPEKIEDAISSFRKRVEPVAKTMAGFKGSYFLVDHKTGKIVGIAFWDTLADLEASNPTAVQLAGQVTQDASATEMPQIEIFEVAVKL